MTAATTCDTSVLVPALLGWHEQHERAARRLPDIAVVPGHVLVETYSVITRLPEGHRLAPADAAELLRGLDLGVIALEGTDIKAAMVTLATAGVKGGATYDGLIAATAMANACVLLTADRRASDTYHRLGADVAYLK